MTHTKFKTFDPVMTTDKMTIDKTHHFISVTRPLKHIVNAVEKELQKKNAPIQFESPQHLMKTSLTKSKREMKQT